MTNNEPSILAHFRDWMALPFVVTVIIPFMLYNIGIPLFKEQPAVTKVIGPALYLCGLALQLYTTVLFKRFAQGTLAPWQPTHKLVIRGPYRYCRNPMITGVLMMLAGEALFLNARGIAIWTTMFFIVNTCFFIFKEEPDMLARFGAAYEAYKKQVPRWIPKLTPYKGE
jgi:protein-S-isoprenylcysteine O-methyltransferase Ste14